MNYEKSFKRLEEILFLLEEGAQTLDESLELYEEGIKLYRNCNSLLENAQLKITTFLKGDEIAFDLEEE